MKILTSDQPEDDHLAKLLSEHDIDTFRGSLIDTLSRFTQAARELNDDDIIFRMTADNLVPDGNFVEDCLSQYEKSSVDYMTTIRDECGPLPYGLSAEIFTVSKLRWAQHTARTAFEREHVTPVMRRGITADNFLSFSDMFSGLRCTMDTLDDYMRILDIFSGQDVVTVSWKALCHSLQKNEKNKHKMPSKELHGRIIPACSLGTAQIGLPYYGVTNEHGQPKLEEAHDILRSSYEHGILLWDTAAVYGNAEEVVGSFWQQTRPEQVTIITKLPPLTCQGQDINEDTVRAAVYKSCLMLGKTSLDYLLLHQWADYTAEDGLIWKTLLSMKEEGWIGRLGASLYYPAQMEEALEEKSIDFIQVPFNLLDRRYKMRGLDQRVRDLKERSESELIIQARSIFLQGLLINQTDRPPEINGFIHKQLLADLDGFVEKFSRLNRRDLCISYVRAQDWIDTLVLGMETRQQVFENATLFYNNPLTQEQCAELEAFFHSVPLDLLDPSTWS